MGTLVVIRVVALIEASTVTGPAKNLIQFCQNARRVSEGGMTADVSIATFVRHGSPVERGAPQLTNSFLEAARAAGVTVDVITEQFRFDLRVIGQVRDVLRVRAPDIVQTHGVKSHFLVRLSGPHRCRWIAFHHGYTADDMKMRVYNQFNRWSLRGADRVVTVCNPFIDVLARTGVQRERIEVLPNSIAAAPLVRPAEVSALRMRLGIGERERVILSVGRFSQEKAQIDLIPPLVELQRRRPDLPLRMVLVGEGPERGKVAAAAAAAGVAERVVFAGHELKTGAYYGLADVFVLPSHSEGSPNVVLEAMMARVPIVATAVGGVPEMVCHEESALIVPPRDCNALAAALERLLIDAALRERLVNDAERVARERFSPEAYRQSLMRVYASVHAPVQRPGSGQPLSIG